MTDDRYRSPLGTRYASAAMQTAEVAALDAAVARREADAIKQR